MKKRLYLLPLATGLLISQACLAAAPKAHEAACPSAKFPAFFAAYADSVAPPQAFPDYSLAHVLLVPSAQPPRERGVQGVERLDLPLEIGLHVPAQLGLRRVRRLRRVRKDPAYSGHVVLCGRGHAGYAIGAVLRAGLKNGVLTTVAGTRWRRLGGGLGRGAPVRWTVLRHPVER